MNVLNEIRAIVAEELEIDEASLKDDGLLIDRYGMDSVMAMDIADELEARFGITIPETRVREFKTVNALLEIVNGLLGVGSSLASQPEC